jgi:hypothetical protein
MPSLRHSGTVSLENFFSWSLTTRSSIDAAIGLLPSRSSFTRRYVAFILAQVVASLNQGSALVWAYLRATAWTSLAESSEASSPTAWRTAAMSLSSVWQTCSTSGAISSRASSSTSYVA